MEFLEALIKISEKAGNIARVIRQDEHLFKLLVQQKDDSEANPRFVDDFKTLADVLIQEMVKYDLGTQFPEIKGRIRGEESNIFRNKLDEEIVVDIKENLEDTANLLEIVLNGDKEAAYLLAQEVHKSVSVEEVDVIKCTDSFSLDVGRLGIWIDPIDSTAEYINAVDKQQDNISLTGLNCVTILIGAFDIENGEPVVGVVNQPFSKYKSDSNQWKGQCFWGICTDSIKLSSLTIPDIRSNNACLSTTEDEEVKWKLKRRGYNLIEAAGAGYKILTVIKGQADCYILSKNSTFKWDTCGPQAILKSLGGDIINYNEALSNNIVSLKYPRDYDRINNCNEGGLIAYRVIEVLQDLIEYST